MIRVRLAEENCPGNIQRILGSYLENRSVSLRYLGEEVERQTTKGCVQGSIGGPILWDLLLDPLLKDLEARGYYVQAFADDVVLLFDGDSGSSIERGANAALSYVQEWGVRNKLKFAAHKTKAVTFTRKLKYDTPRLSMGGVSIEMASEVKVLGVTIDSSLTFNSHIRSVCAKAISFHKQLSRAAKVTWGLNPEVVRIMYTAVLEPVILYAASVWAPSATKLGVRKQLNTVQRGFAQKMCRAYKTVSLNSAMVLSGLLPLDLRIKEVASLYEAKRGVEQPMLGDREVEMRVAYANTTHPASQIELQFGCLMDQEQVDAQRLQAVRIFTDGSLIEGQVGASLSFWDNEVETKSRKIKLASYCTVYQAELLAIREATAAAWRRAERSFGIYSDSRSALQSLCCWSSVNPLAFEARENIRQCVLQGKQVSLYWVKAHVDVRENERADELAKAAALSLKVKPLYDKCPVSFVKRQFRMGTVDEWNRRYCQESTASVTKLFFPEVTRAFKTVRQIGLTGLHTQLFTGHGGFSEYLNRFGCKENPSCICDDDKQEDIPHLIFWCPVYTRERYDCESRLQVEIRPENMHVLIGWPPLKQGRPLLCGPGESYPALRGSRGCLSRPLAA
ncbi:hypothetical protein K1T71_014703 [Dendrolimus kikuchii]|uniref:Uncharacterized protein n=1 Tax=Dendrolimus kikuchii TaxID=765133 RepID=A0ACC1CF20_9NEOP|nr:hypothetical protein K1T71_014703 [Dendrolimus kikuchii]